MMLDVGGFFLEFNNSWDWACAYEKHTLYKSAFKKVQGMRNADVVGLRRDGTVLILEVKNFSKVEAPLSIQVIQQQHAKKVASQIRDTILALHLLPQVDAVVHADAPVNRLRGGVIGAVERRNKLFAAWSFALWDMAPNRKKDYVKRMRTELKNGLLYCGAEVLFVDPEFSEVPGLHMIRKEAA